MSVMWSLTSASLALAPTLPAASSARASRALFSLTTSAAATTPERVSASPNLKLENVQCLKLSTQLKLNAAAVRCQGRAGGCPVNCALKKMKLLSTHCAPSDTVLCLDQETHAKT